jgi:UDP-N-acetylmuramate dehydrogenase
MTQIQAQLKKVLPALKLKEPLSCHTTFQIGGPAEFFFEAKTITALVKAVKLARQLKLPFQVIGHGSNLLVADQGLKGLVIKNSSQKIKILDKPSSKQTVSAKISSRYQPLEDQPLASPLAESYDPTQYPPVLVELDSGVFLPRAIFSLVEQGITGLECFAGIPATVGGAVFINLHGADRFFSDFLLEAKILTPDNQLKTVPAVYFEFDYDSSRLKTNQDIVLAASLSLCRGPQETALRIAKNWAHQKSHQPQRSAGCIFQNLSDLEQARLNLPTPSIGYLIDKVLGLKGKTIGQARIADKHAGFIENLGRAKAQDVLGLINLVKASAKKKLKLELKLEIVLLGFNKV